MPAEEGADGDQDETKESVTLAGQRLNRLKTEAPDLHREFGGHGKKRAQD